MNKEEVLKQLSANYDVEVYSVHVDGVDCVNVWIMCEIADNKEKKRKKYQEMKEYLDKNLEIFLDVITLKKELEDGIRRLENR